MEQPYLQQLEVCVQAVHDFLLQHNNKLYLFISELMDIMHWMALPMRPLQAHAEKDSTLSFTCSHFKS
eukprot:138374-Pelagomonas_calceolata.AAC.1